MNRNTKNNDSYPTNIICAKCGKHLTQKELEVGQCKTCLARDNESTKAEIPFMIIRTMRQQLNDLGYSSDQIDKMKPKVAWNIIEKQKTAKQFKKELNKQIIANNYHQNKNSLHEEIKNNKLTLFEKDNVKLATGEYVSKNVFDSLTYYDQMKLWSEGAIAYNAYLDEQNKLNFQKDLLSSKVVPDRALENVFKQRKEKIKSTSKKPESSYISYLPQNKHAISLSNLILAIFIAIIIIIIIIMFAMSPITRTKSPYEANIIHKIISIFISQKT